MCVECAKLMDTEDILSRVGFNFSLFRVYTLLLGESLGGRSFKFPTKHVGPAYSRSMIYGNRSNIIYDADGTRVSENFTRDTNRRTSYASIKFYVILKSS